ncbi:DUF6554 family protein [Prochlorococcus marinus]|uniref:Type II secretion system-like protein n=1 Tax=Prochlorococcus marinus XMU1408 TaxID=2213228 RepID=A0A318RC69_PROMR|nr:DUF6554 family protein [Prochlorococcus marinus]MBW3042593.1 type II secretion system-like protein [Prochlorococcus marinus str. XMU1408]PYE03638.1 type II secretion system-like protein [Prochlorococcus marinus XMU1408]
MPIEIKRNFLPISIICLLCGTTLGTKTNAAVTNGADIYCFMRNGGNTHEPSWQAAYQFIKSKKQGLFKTSPKQAASFIVEEVVQDPIKYEDCINYLGDLYTGDSTPITISNDDKLKDDKSIEKTPKGMNLDRYNY